MPVSDFVCHSRCLRALQYHNAAGSDADTALLQLEQKDMSLLAKTATVHSVQAPVIHYLWDLFSKLDKDTALTATVDLLAAAALDDRRDTMVTSWNCTVPVAGAASAATGVGGEGATAIAQHQAMCQQSALLVGPANPPPLMSDLRESWTELEASKHRACILVDPEARLPDAVPWIFTSEGGGSPVPPAHPSLVRPAETETEGAMGGKDAILVEIAKYVCPACYHTHAVCSRSGGILSAHLQQSGAGETSPASLPYMLD